MNHEEDKLPLLRDELPTLLGRDQGNNTRWECFGVITLIFTRYSYLELVHLIFLLFQATTEQLFLKRSFLNAHAPCSTTTRVYMLADPLQPMCTYRSTKNGKLQMEHTFLGKLTKLFDHPYLVTRPNT
jgi:hypothetical protein